MPTCKLDLIPELLGEIEVTSRPFVTMLCLGLSDSLALLASVGLGTLVKSIFHPGLVFENYLRLWPFLFVFLIVYKVIGLYSIVGLSPREERRRGSISSAILFLLLGAVTMSVRGAQQQFTWTLFLAIGISVMLLPFMRTVTRRLFAFRDWWGYPAVIFGAGEAGQRILRAIGADSAMGLKPLALVDENSTCSHLGGILVFDSFEKARKLVTGRSAYAVFAARDIPMPERDKIIDRYSEYFSHVLLIPELNGLSNRWMSSKNIGGSLGLELRTSDWKWILGRATA